jgi:uncharacterized SAM-binding protein YcdF (DUF218 family)
MRLLRTLLLLGLLPGLALGLGFLGFLRVAAAPPEQPERRTDGIVVLTGGAERIATGLRLLREDQGRWMLISGVHRDTMLEDLATGAELGALAQRVELGRVATSTRGNALEVAEWARTYRLHSIRVVTAGYHMPRAMLELRRALPGMELLAWPVVPARLRQAGALGELRTWSLLVGEYLKLLLAWTGLPALTPAAALTPLLPGTT